MFRFLMEDVDVGWGDTPKWVVDVLQPIINVLDSLLLPIIIILGVAGMIYGIVLGVQYAKAESADKRDENKKRMIHAVVGIIIMLVLLILMKVFTANADGIFGWVESSAGSGQVQVTIHYVEIGNGEPPPTGKISKQNAAGFLVATGIASDEQTGFEMLGNKSEYTVYFTQEEWKTKIKGIAEKSVYKSGLTIKGVETNAVLPDYNSEWVKVSLA